MAKPNSKKTAPDIEFVPDAGQRFERTIDVVAKIPPPAHLARELAKEGHPHVGAFGWPFRESVAYMMARIVGCANRKK